MLEVFSKRPAQGCTLKIQKLLPDNGKEFMERLFATCARQPTGEHEFDQRWQALDIEHCLTPPEKGMVERFNRRMTDVLNTHRF